MNGHTFAAGFLLALACDYRVITSGKAWASMNEIHFGATMPRAFAALVKAKSPSPVVTRKIFLEGHRFVPEELLALGLVDQTVEGGTEKVLEAALALGAKWAPHAKGSVWGLQKVCIFGLVAERPTLKNCAARDIQGHTRCRPRYAVADDAAGGG